MNKLIKRICWSISILISLVLIVLICKKLYVYLNAKSTVEPYTILSETINDSNLDIVFGNDKADLTIYMYSNYTCKYCKAFFEEVIPNLQSHFDSNQLRLVVKLVGTTSNESFLLGHRTAVCVSEYGNYNALHKLFTHNFLVVLTQEFKQMVDEFIVKDDLVAQCILEGEADDYLNANNDEFERLGLKGTPAFVIGNKVFKGYRNLKSFMYIVDSETNTNK